MKINCFARNRNIRQGCGFGEPISTAPAQTIPAPEKNTIVIVTPAPKKNVPAAPAPVLTNMSDTGGSCFCCMGHGPFCNYHLLTPVNKFSGVDGSSFILRTDTGGSRFISDPG